MPVTKADLEKEIEELQRKLDEAQEAHRKSQETAEALLSAEKARAQAAEQEIEKLRRVADELRIQKEVEISRAKDTIRDELHTSHQRELETRDELNGMLREKVNAVQGRMESLEKELSAKGSRIAELESSHPPPRPSRHPTDDLLGLGLGDSADPSDTSAERTGIHEHLGTGLRHRLHSTLLPNFNGEDADDGAFDRWVKKLQRCAEVDSWSDREQLLQFELHLTGRAEATYDVLPMEVKTTFKSAMDALRGRLQPVKREALKSAELMKRKQTHNESVDLYAQEFERLFLKSYGSRGGMDTESKEMLKRDLFVQGLLLKWQKKVLPSADSFNDALYQARAAEEQEKQLSELHQPAGSKDGPTQRRGGTNSQPRQNSATSEEPRSNPSQGGTASNPQPRRSFLGKCRNCGAVGHKARYCTKGQPPTEATGQQRDRGTNRSVTTSTVSTEEPQEESLEERCHRLQQELAQTELQRMSAAYDDFLKVEAVNGAVGPLFHGEVNMAGVPVKGLIDTGSGATIISFEIFKKIGKTANIPSSSLYPVDLILRDYNRNPIPMGAQVDMEISWKEKCITVPVHIRSASDPNGEPCLLGSNVAIPLGLMVPGEGIEASNLEHQQESNQHGNIVRLVQATRVPGRSSAVIRAQVEGDLKEHPVIFQPDAKFMAQTGVQIEDSILSPDCQGQIYLTAINPAHDFQKLLPHTLVGQVESLVDAEPVSDPAGTLPNQDSNEHLILSVMGHEAALQEIEEAQRKRAQLENQLHISPDGRTEQEVASLQECILNSSDVFAVGSEHGRVDPKIVEHSINTGDHPPIKQASRRVPFAVRGEVTKMINNMLADNVVQESASPWASPIVLAKKKDGSLRFCVDYRRLNAVTTKDVFPLPRIDDLLDKMRGKSVFSTLDAKTGYWQIQMGESSREKTAFITSEGLYEFQVMPFGLCNAPATFQRLMQRILRGLEDFCSVYIDDVIVFSSSIEEHLDHLQQIFARLRRVGLKLQPKKCIFGSQEVLYLGHLVSAKGIYPNPAKTKAVKEFPIPTNVKAVRRFLGLASYYRRFVPNFAKVASPLHALTRQDVPFQWTAQCQQAFERLKDLLTSPPVLAYPNFAAKFVLHTDASGEGLGAVLEQEQDGKLHPVAYASRSLTKSEKNYGVTELEALGVVWAVKHFRSYLIGHKCVIFTDHAPLKSMLAAKHPSGKLARWSQTLAEVNVEIQYRPGRKHSNADALSRAPINLQEESVAAVQATLNGTESPTTAADPLNPESEMAELQRADANLQPIFHYLEKGELPADEKKARKLVLESSRFSIIDGVLYFVDNSRQNRLRLAAPMSIHEKLLKENHSEMFSGHFSVKSLYEKLAKRYWWQGMYVDVYSHCKSCLTCASYRGAGHRTRPPLKPLDVGGPFERIGVDILEMPKTERGNSYIVVFMDYLTKWPEAYATSDQSSETIARLLVENVICRHGVPKELLSDRGPNLLSNLMLDICDIMGMKKVNTTAYHPQTDGLVENFNRTLRAMIAKHAKKFGCEWDVYLPQLLFAYRTKPHESTGESPFYLLYGRDAKLPTETAFTRPWSPYLVDIEDYRTELTVGLTESWKQAKQNVCKAQTKQKKYYDHRSKEIDFKVGERVMVYMPQEAQGKNHKLALPYHGPYRILEVQTNCLLLRPVDKPDMQAILVSMDRVTRCPKELPNTSWLGPKPKRNKTRKSERNTVTTMPPEVSSHSYNLRSKANYKINVVVGQSEAPEV